MTIYKIITEQTHYDTFLRKSENKRQAICK